MHKRKLRKLRQIRSPIWKDGPHDPSVLRGELGTRFLRAFLSDFARKGRRTIEALRRHRRQDYLRLGLALLPKEIRLREVEIPEMSDEEFAETLAAIRKMAGEEEGNGIGTAVQTVPFEDAGDPRIEIEIV